MSSVLRDLWGIAATLALVAAPATVALAQGATPAGPPTIIPGARGFVLGTSGGERFTYCARPLTLWIKLDSRSSPTTSLVAGTGEIRGDEGVGRHARRHEVVYIRSGWGRAVFAERDTFVVGPGTVIYVPPGTRHRFISTGRDPLDYFWVIGPMSSAEGFREAARMGCDTAPATPPPSPERPIVDSLPHLVRVLAPTDGERISYCELPLVITAKIDSVTVAGTALRAATGSLRRGSEEGVHGVDEVVLVTHGRGRAFVGSDTVAVEAGSVMHAPKGMRHGFINDGGSTLEYFIVYGGAGGRSGFHRWASRPGPWCP